MTHWVKGLMHGSRLVETHYQCSHRYDRVSRARLRVWHGTRCSPVVRALLPDEQHQRLECVPDSDT